MPIVRSAARESPKMTPATPSRHIDKGRITDDIYRSMIQQLFPSTSQFLDASTRMELAFTHVEKCSTFFFECLGKSADCAMTSAVSSDMAETLVDMSDTYLRLIHSISSKVPDLKSNLMDIISKKLQLSIKSTPLALREHNSLMRSKTEKLAKAVKELHKCNEKSMHKNSHMDERLDRSLNSFKEADSDLREYKDFAYKIAAVEERRFIATFIELVSELTEAYLGILQLQMEVLKEKTIKWSETSKLLKEKLRNPLDDFDFRHGAPLHAMSNHSSASGYSGSEMNQSDRNTYGDLDHTYNKVHKDGRRIVVHENGSMGGGGSLPRMKVTFKKNSYKKRTPMKRTPVPKTDNREIRSGHHEPRLGHEGRDSQRQKRSKVSSGGGGVERGGRHQRHNTLILMDSNGGGTITSIREETHVNDSSKGASKRSGSGSGSGSRQRSQLVRADFNFVPQKGDGIQMELQEGDVINIIHKAPLHNGWQYGLNKRTNKQGWFPVSFTQPLHSKVSPEHDENDYEQLSEYGGQGGGGGGSSNESSTMAHRPDLPAPDYNAELHDVNMSQNQLHNHNNQHHHQHLHHQSQSQYALQPQTPQPRPSMAPAPPPPPPPPPPPVMGLLPHPGPPARGAIASNHDCSPERNNLFANAKLRKPSVVNDRSGPVVR